MVPSRFQLSPAVMSTPLPARRPFPVGDSNAMTPAARPFGLDLPLSCSATSTPLVAVLPGSTGAGEATGALGALEGVVVVLGGVSPGGVIDVGPTAPPAGVPAAGTS